MGYVLSVNQKYPFPIREGLSTNFLSSSGNVIQLGLHNITQDELLALKKHSVKCGILIQQPVILWLFDFGKGGQYDAPFDAKLYTREQLQLFNIDNQQQRLLIEMHVVELSNNTLKVLRGFTLSPDLTVKFLSAVQDQIATPCHESAYNTKLNLIYQKPITDLLNIVKLYKCGG